MIGLAFHHKLLRLYGFCMTPGERMLVDSCTPNGKCLLSLKFSRIGIDECMLHLELSVDFYIYEQCNANNSCKHFT